LPAQAGPPTQAVEAFLVKRLRLTSKRAQAFASSLVGCFLGAPAAALLVSFPLLAARGPRGVPNPIPVRTSGPTDPKELEAFLDPILSSGMARWHIPGAVFLLVKDSRVFFAKGYGYSDLAKAAAVDPDKTVFRVGSVSKLFTATAVLQLAERGQVDLHTDVNRYLKTFQVDENFPAPVTLANLLTHTGGFDDRAIGIAARSPGGQMPLGEYLAHSMPPRVRPPGEMYNYSSHGMALAGYIVETVSGQPFADYVEKNILGPLEMRRSSFLLTGVPPGEIARGYAKLNGTVTSVPYDFFNIGPAVGLNSTASDMAHFMIANLEGGVFDGHRLLSEQTLAEMHREQYTDDPALPGRTYGFYEKYRNGWRTIGHGGNIRGFGSLLLLVPEARLGVFISTNLDEPRFDDDLVQKFFDHYFPPKVQVDPPVPKPAFLTEAADYVGSYRINPYSRTTLEKLATLNWQYRITAVPDGTLELHSPRDYTPATRWVEVTPQLFERADGGGRAVFRRDASGRVTALVLDTGVLEKLAWYETAAFQVNLVKTLLLVFLSVGLVWPLDYASRRILKRPRASSWSQRWGRLIAVAGGASAVVFIVGFVRLARHMDFWEFIYGIPAPIHKLLAIPTFTALAACGMLFLDVRAWAKGVGSVFDRLYYTLLTVAALVFVWFLLFWNLLKVR
jgi:CubicO group peptidase (beta-lactamase class C family)